MLTTREIRPIGTALRVVVGLFLLYFAALGGGSWDIAWYEAGIGFVVFPVVVIGTGLIARRLSDDPVHFTGLGGHLANLGIIVLLIANPYTADAAALFYGATMLVAGWRGQRGCEGTVISNLILGRNDQIGCPLFAPLDELEDHLSRRHRRRSTPTVQRAGTEKR